MKNLLCIMASFLLIACSEKNDNDTVSGPTHYKRMCYDSYLGYNDVCSHTSKFYDEKLCDLWNKGAYDEETALYDGSYTVGPVKECIENINFE